MTYDEAMKLAEEVFDEEYSGWLNKKSFLIGFEEAYNALTALYKDNFELIKRMRKAQNNSPYKHLTYWNNIEEVRRFESEVDELLKKLN